MNDQTNQNRHTKFDNKTLTLVTTALVAASNLIPNDIWKKACAAASPCATMAFGWIFHRSKNMIYLWIEQWRAERVYNEIIAELNVKLNNCKNIKEKARIKKELDKYQNDLNDLKIKNIKAFV